MSLIDVAVSYKSDLIMFEYIDEFVHQNSVYAFMNRIDTTDVMMFEELELNGRKLGKGLEDTCFIPVYDPVTQAIAMERNTKGDSAHFKGNQFVVTGMRSIDEYEKDLGRKISTSDDMIFYHGKAEL